MILTDRRSMDEVISETRQALGAQDEDLETRARALATEIERRLASGPATPMDFSEVKRRIREEVEAQKSK